MRTRIQTPKKILIIGSTCVDIIINVDHLPKTEEDIHPFSQSMALGGCAYNAANIIRQFGAPHTFISPVGTGVYGDYVRKELKQKGFQTVDGLHYNQATYRKIYAFAVRETSWK